MLLHCMIQERELWPIFGNDSIFFLNDTIKQCLAPGIYISVNIRFDLDRYLLITIIPFMHIVTIIKKDSCD